MLAASAHIGLAGDFMSDETREWWGRAGGVQLLISLALIVLSAVALLGPHTFDLVRQQLAVLDLPESTVKVVLGVAWALVTTAGVLVGRSNRTGMGRGPSLLEFIGRVAPVAFVFGYLLILATFIQVAVPQLAVAPWRRRHRAHLQIVRGGSPPPGARERPDRWPSSWPRTKRAARRLGTRAAPRRPG